MPMPDESSTPGASASPPSSPLLSPACLASTVSHITSALVSIWVIRGLFESLPSLLVAKEWKYLAGWLVALGVAVAPASALPIIGRVAGRFLNPGQGGK